MVVSDGPSGVGPAVSALGVWGRESLARWPPKGGHVMRPEPKCQPRDGPRSRGQVLTDSLMNVPHEDTAGCSAPRQHHPRGPSWSPELMESLETS